MRTDESPYYHAWLARDPRFDGRFFTAVVTTGIYCRPVCPARRPARRNVRFYTCAAAAESAGFRPCLRCRPETAPGSPPWLGTSTTVTRALRLIEDGALDRDGVEGLAARLGVTDRWLRQLFDDQLGASPLAVARTRRIHFARRLLDDTAMPLEDVAQAAGFGSARRLRDAIQATFHRSPSALRRRRTAPDGGRPVAARAGIRLRVAARAPFSAVSLFRFFAARAIPGVETVDDGIYRRGAVLGDEVGLVEVTPSRDRLGLDARWSGRTTRGLLDVTTRISRVFDLEADVGAIGAHLARDPALARLWPAEGLRIPGAWDPFEAVVRALLGQQISVAGARTIAGRLAQRCGTPLGSAGTTRITHAFPTAAQVARADLEGLGLTRARRAAVRGVAQAVVSGTVDLSAPCDLEEGVAALTRLPGVGPWTAHIVAMRAWAATDAFPAGDLGVRKALARRGRMPSQRETEARAERWRPWRAYAAIALWSAGATGAAHTGGARTARAGAARTGAPRRTPPPSTSNPRRSR